MLSLRALGKAAACAPLGAAAALICLLAVAGCGPPPAAESSAEAAGLPEFTAAEAALFDDTISLDVFEPALSEMEPAADPKLSERTLQADAVVPVKVTTVTSDSSGELRAYQITVVPREPAIVGSVDPLPVTLVIASQSPSFPFVKSADASLVGRLLILMFKRYNVEGKVTVHWHLEADSNEVRTAIGQARALEEIGS